MRSPDPGGRGPAVGDAGRTSIPPAGARARKVPRLHACAGRVRSAQARAQCLTHRSRSPCPFSRGGANGGVASAGVTPNEGACEEPAKERAVLRASSGSSRGRGAAGGARRRARARSSRRTRRGSWPCEAQDDVAVPVGPSASSATPVPGQAERRDDEQRRRAAASRCAAGPSRRTPVARVVAQQSGSRCCRASAPPAGSAAARRRRAPTGAAGSRGG